MPEGNPAPQRYYATLSWESYALRAEKRIRRQIEAVTLSLWSGLTLAQVARIPGSPGLRTMRRWASANLYGFGREYHSLVRVRGLERLRASVEADLRQIQAKAEQGNRTGQDNGTR